MGNQAKARKKRNNETGRSWHCLARVVHYRWQPSLLLNGCVDVLHAKETKRAAKNRLKGKRLAVPGCKGIVAFQHISWRDDGKFPPTWVYAPGPRAFPALLPQAEQVTFCAAQPNKSFLPPYLQASIRSAYDFHPYAHSKGLNSFIRAGCKKLVVLAVQ